MSSNKKMPWVAFLGADGSGKSTIIDGITDYLNSKDIEVVYQHWRPVLGEKAESSGPVSDPHSKPARGLVSSWLRIFMLWGIWWTSYFKVLSRLRNSGKFIIFDRFYADLLVDPRRYRYGGGHFLASAVFKFMPKPTLVFLLDADAEVLYARKPEVELPQLKIIVSKYRDYISGAKNGVLINSDQSVEVVLNDVRQQIDRILESS